MTKRKLSWLLLFPLLLFLCYYNTGAVHAASPEIEASESGKTSARWHTQYFLVPEEENGLLNVEESYPNPNKKGKPVDKHRFNTKGYKNK